MADELVAEVSSRTVAALTTSLALATPTRDGRLLMEADAADDVTVSTALVNATDYFPDYVTTEVANFGSSPSPRLLDRLLSTTDTAVTMVTDVALGGSGGGSGDDDSGLPPDVDYSWTATGSGNWSGGSSMPHFGYGSPSTSMSGLSNLSLVDLPSNFLNATSGFYDDVENRSATVLPSAAKPSSYSPFGFLINVTEQVVTTLTAPLATKTLTFPSITTTSPTIHSNSTVTSLLEWTVNETGSYLVNASSSTVDTSDMGATMTVSPGNGSSYAQDDLWNGSIYPSGHTMPHIIITAVLVTSLMIMVVVGNMLVIVAIVTEKALKTIQNWFIASLAVADFLLGLVVMPFSLAQELMGYWIFGVWWCEIHLAVDVLLCTSSIMNLCLISLDRYWSITQAVDYLKKRTPGRAAVMITMVWVLSFLIAVPPMMGWKKFATPQDVPFCEVSNDLGYVIYSASGSFYIPSIIMVFVYVRIYFAARSRARRNVKKHRPALDPTKDKSTTTTSFSNASPPDRNKNAAVGATVAAVGCCAPGLSHAHHHSNQLMVPPSPGVGGMLAPPPPVAIISCSASSSAPSANSAPSSSSLLRLPLPTPNSPSPAESSVSEDDRSDGSTRHLSPASNNNSEVSEPLLASHKQHQVLLTLATQKQQQLSPQVSIVQQQPLASPRPGSTHHHHGGGQHGGGAGGGKSGSGFFRFGGAGGSGKANGSTRTLSVKSASPSPSRLVSQAHALAQAQAQILLSDDMECLSELDHSSDSDQPHPDAPKLTGFQRLQNLCNPSRKAAHKAAAAAAAAAKHECEMDLVRAPPKPRDPEREKRRIARKKERRATLILGLIMAAFILSWLPFFTIYVFRGICKTCHVEELGFTFAFWLGYCNSALNPVIYTIFNKDFRKAFRKILFK